MEKLVYLVWSGDGGSDRWTGDVIDALVPRLLDLGVAGLQINADDAPVASVAMRMSGDGDPPAMFVGVWLDDLAPERVTGVDAAIGVHGRFAAYLVEHHEPLPNASPAPLGTRTPGFVNMALLRRPARLGREEWLAAWQGDHTAVAIEIQSTRRYVQNVVVRRLSDDGPELAGIVEELFPPDGIADMAAMFDAAGDDALFGERLTQMNDSVERFLDVADLTVVPTSEYIFREVV